MLRFTAFLLSSLMFMIQAVHAVGFDQAECRRKVEENICERLHEYDKKCRMPAHSVAEDILAIYDVYPPVFQKMMCHLKEITLVHDFEFSGQVTEGGRVISLKKELATREVAFSTWASWKEQLPFSQKTSRYEVDFDEVFITAAHRSGLNGGLMFILTHELAHVLDGLNDITDQENPSFSCFKWGRNRVSALADFIRLHGDICFYRQCAPVTRTNRYDIYGRMYEKGFPTLYSLKNPKEDFAELATFFIMRELADLKYFVHLPDGTVIDVMGKLNTPPMHLQIRYMEGLFARHDLIVEAAPDDTYPFGPDAGLFGGAAALSQLNLPPGLPPKAVMRRTDEAFIACRPPYGHGP